MEAELFLLLVSSVFVPLFGVFGHYFVRRRRRWRGQIFARQASAGSPSCLDPRVRRLPLGVALVPPRGRTQSHALGEWLSLPYPLFSSRLGANLQNFVVAFSTALVLVPGRSAPAGHPVMSGLLLDASGNGGAVINTGQVSLAFVIDSSAQPAPAVSLLATQPVDLDDHLPVDETRASSRGRRSARPLVAPGVA
jgi:hypothetical protein